MPPGDTARLYHRLSSVSYLPEDAWPDPYMPPPLDHPLVLHDFDEILRQRFEMNVDVVPHPGDKSVYGFLDSGSLRGRGRHLAVIIAYRIGGTEQQCWCLVIGAGC